MQRADDQRDSREPVDRRAPESLTTTPVIDSPEQGGVVTIPSKRYLRRVGLTAIVVGAAALFVVSKRNDLPMAWHAIRHSHPVWLVAAATLSFLIVANLAGTQARSQGLLGVHRPFRSVLSLTASGHFLNLITKSGGMAGVTGFNADSRRRGLPVERTTAGYILAELSTHLGFTVVLILSLPMIARDGKLTGADLAAVVVFTVMTGVFLAGVIAAARSRIAIRRLHAAPDRVRKVVDRVMRRPKRPSSVDFRAADDLHDTMVLARQHRRGLWPLAVHALLYPLIGVSLLWVTFRAVGLHQGLQVALVSYVIATTFSIVGFLPGGIGFTELSLVATLSSYGIPAGPAAAVVGLYRLFDLWLPLLAGAIALHRNPRPDASVTETVNAARRLSTQNPAMTHAPDATGAA